MSPVTPPGNWSPSPEIEIENETVWFLAFTVTGA